MFKLNNTRLVTRVSTKYEIQGSASDEERQHIIKKALTINPKLIITGGTSISNPYKQQYDVYQAEQREQLEMYKQSILWSPEFTPRKFILWFLYPSIGVCFMLWYIRYIQWPSQMLKIKKRYGLTFPDLEKKGWLEDWEDEEDDTQNSDYTLQDIQFLESQQSNNIQQQKKLTEKHSEEYFMREKHKESEAHLTLKKQMQDQYNKKQQQQQQQV